jgi:hypothetical protein
LIGTYLDPFLGLKFVASRGWYEVSDEDAEVLSKVRQKRYDSLSPKAFAIANNVEEAKYIEENVFRPPKKEDEVIGTIETPIPAKKARPGKRPGKDTKQSSRPRGRPRGRKRSMSVDE